MAQPGPSPEDGLLAAWAARPFVENFPGMEAHLEAMGVVADAAHTPPGLKPRVSAWTRLRAVSLPCFLRKGLQGGSVQEAHHLLIVGVDIGVPADTRKMLQASSKGRLAVGIGQ